MDNKKFIEVIEHKDLEGLPELCIRISQRPYEKGVSLIECSFERKVFGSTQSYQSFHTFSQHTTNENIPKMLAEAYEIFVRRLKGIDERNKELEAEALAKEAEVCSSPS